MLGQRLQQRIIALFLAILMLMPTLSTSVTYATSVSEEATESTSLQGERIYQIMVDRFYDGDPSNNATGEAFRYGESTEDDFKYMHGGDWQGIIDKLSYIKGMGYTAIWISPVSDPQLWSVPGADGAQVPTAYHGYNVYDPNRANRYFGAEDPVESKQILKELVDACHAQGIKVIFDVVPNHIGDYIKGTGTNAAYSNATSYKTGTQLQPAAPFNNVNWYHNLGEIDWSQEHPHTASTIQMLENHDLGGLDDIDLDIPQAKQAIYDSIEYWFDYTGADAARVDAAKCMKPSDIHELQEQLGVPTFGENFDMCVDFVADWVGENAETGMLDFPLFQAIVNGFAYGNSFSDTNSISLKSVLDQDYLYGDSANEMVVFIDNHDRNRFLTEAGGNVDRLQNALTFLFTVRGVPCVFQGTEQNRGNANNQLMGGIADIWNRWCMVQKDSNGNVIKDYFNTSTDTYQLIQDLSELKDSYPALSYGTQREMWAEPNVYVFSRRIDTGVDTGDEIICAFNNSDTSRSVFVPLRAESSISAGTILENVFDSSDRITVSNSEKIAITVGPNSNKIYKVSENQTAAALVPVTFTVHNATTEMGQNVYIAGNHEALGNWNPSNAAGPASCPLYPTWSVTVNLPVGQTIQFKAIKRDIGDVAWETCGNRSYTVPSGGGSIAFDWSIAGETKLVPVKFTVKNAQTVWQENIYIVGSVAELGTWSVDLAVGPALCPDYPTWTVYIDLPAGATIEWKALKKGGSAVVWQSGNNNSCTIPVNGVGNTSCTWS